MNRYLIIDLIQIGEMPDDTVVLQSASQQDKPMVVPVKSAAQQLRFTVSSCGTSGLSKPQLQQVISCFGMFLQV